VRRKQGDLDGARASYEASAEIDERLAAQDPTNLDAQRELCVGRGNLGDLLRKAGDLDAALASYRAALTIAQRLATLEPTNAGRQSDLSVTLGKLATVLRERGDLDGALANRRAALAIDAQMAEKEPTNARFLRSLARSHSKLGDLVLAANDADGALAEYRTSLDILERLSAEQPANTGWRRDVAVGQKLVGRVLLRLGQYADAVEVMRTAERVHAEVAEAEARFASEHHAWVTEREAAEMMSGARSPESSRDHLQLARTRRRMGLYTEAVRDFERALTNEALRTDPDEAVLYDAACAAALASAAQPEDAKTYVAQAIAWLGQDLAVRRAALERLDSAADGEGANRRAERRAALMQQIERAHTSDPDFASIRGTPEFQRLFESLPK
jgi:tetratricopeptide (TPR) repeat protein